jgi:hypothetical protein
MLIMQTRNDEEKVEIDSDNSSISVKISPTKRAMEVKRAARISIFINNKNIQAPHDKIEQHQEVKQDAAPVQNSGIMVSLKKLCGC